MNLPRVYVMRNNHPYNYMSETNIRKLREFSEPVIEEACDCKQHIGEEELIRKISGARAILMQNWSGENEITERVLEAAGTVEVIVRAHSGRSKLEEIGRKFGIRFSEGSNAIDLAVAEWTIGTAIMGRRKLTEAGRSLKDEGFWQKDWQKASMLLGSTVGLIGLGRIGRIVARQFKCLGTKVIAYDKYLKPEDDAKLGVKLVGFHELLQQSDVVSLHAPVTPETTGMFGPAEFAMIKDGAVFINSARAALYDENALVAELKKGRFSACLDVFSTEPLNPDHPIRKLDNVYISSHIAGTNNAMYERAGADAIETLRLYFKTGKLRDMNEGLQNDEKPATGFINNQQLAYHDCENCHGGEGRFFYRDLMNQVTDKMYIKCIHDDIIPPGSSFGNHSHREACIEEWYVCLSGEGIMINEGKEYVMKNGDISVCYSGGNHGIKNTGKEDMRLLVISGMPLDA